MLGSEEDFDEFGSSLASGDFNGDGFDDLAIGVIGEDNFAGAVAVIFGSERGLTANGNESWDQNDSGVADSKEDNDEFGLLACGGGLRRRRLRRSGHRSSPGGLAHRCR